MTENHLIKLVVVMPSLAKGGAEKVMTTLLNQLDLTIFDASLLLLDKRGNYLEDLRKEITVYDLGGIRVSRATIRLVKWIRNHKPDIVISSLSHLNLLMGAIRPLLPGIIKVIVRESSIPSIHTQSDRKGKIMFKLYKYFYSNVDAVICQCEFMKNYLRQCFSLPDGFLKVINNPVDTLHIQEQAQLMQDQSNYREDNVLNVVAVGSLEQHKQYDQLIIALSEIDRPWKLRVLGDGSQLNILQELATQLGVIDHIDFVGRKRNPYPYMQQADVLVLVSAFEGFPNVVLEALALGTPVISYNCPGGISEIMNNDLYGLLIAANDCKALSQSLEKFNQSMFNKSLISSNIKERFGLDNIISQYQKVLTN